MAFKDHHQLKSAEGKKSSFQSFNAKSYEWKVNGRTCVRVFLIGLNLMTILHRTLITNYEIAGFTLRHIGIYEVAKRLTVTILTGVTKLRRNF